jgi:hypothetical protein
MLGLGSVPTALLECTEQKQSQHRANSVFLAKCQKAALSTAQIATEVNSPLLMEKAVALIALPESMLTKFSCPSVKSVRRVNTHWSATVHALTVLWGDFRTAKGLVHATIVLQGTLWLSSAVQSAWNVLLAGT